MPDDHKKSSALSLPQNLRRSALATAISLSLLAPAQAATIAVDGSSCTLIEAIDSANMDITFGGCTPGSFGADTLELAPNSVHSLSLVNNIGDNGLPIITSQITIEGNGSTIRRVGTTKFRLFSVSGSLSTPGSLTLNNVTLSNGYASGSSGGAIASGGQLTLNNATISNNTAKSGGGISTSGGLTLNNSTISNNRATALYGGGIISLGSLILNNSTVSGNTGHYGAGGLYNTGQATLNNSTVSGNSAERGGGIMNASGTMTLINSTISGNINGAIFNKKYDYFGNGQDYMPGVVTAINSTITGNSATYSSYSPNTVLIRNLSYYAPNDTITLSNSIITNKEGRSACSGLISNAGNNWFEDDSCGTVAQGDPNIGPLKDNGGATQTHALLKGSGAIDAGDSSICAASPVDDLDQRGAPRDEDISCDIGAFEKEPPMLVNGLDCTLIQAINSANGDSPTGSCGASSVAGPDTLVLENNSVHILNGLDNTLDGYNGLPSITSDITIEGNASSIERDDAALPFRLFHVAASGSLTLDDVTLSNGSAISSGGAIFSKGTLALINSTVSANTASSRGGGLYSDTGQLMLINTTVSDNSSSSDGGGLAIRDSTATLNNSTISSNRARSSGGIYSDESVLTLDNCTVSNNSVTHKGGGLYMTDSIFTLKNSTVSGNVASRGAGVYVYSHYAYSSSTLINSTFSGNSASSYGGAVYVSYGIVDLYNSTVSNNSAALEGAGLYLQTTGDATASLQNSIIANHPSGGDCFDSRGTLIDNGNNWFEDSSCTGFAQGDPGIGNLANNGGPTKTHALITGSGAIGAGDNTACADATTVNNLDQRGETRPDGAQCDIGAFEGSVDETSFMVIPLPGGKTAVIPL